MAKFFTKYNPPKVPGWFSDQESMVQEQFADACQTDTIIRKYNTMGLNPFIASGGSKYLDTTQIPDFICAQNAHIKVREFFEGLPADIRLEFNNDPMNFAEVVSDPQNEDYLREIGVLEPLPPEAGGHKQPASSGDNSEKTPPLTEGSELSGQKQPEKPVSSAKSNG